MGAGAGVAGAVVGKGLSKVFNPISEGLSDNAARLAQYLQENGINLTAAQKTGSKALASLEGVFENLPFTAAPQRKIYDEQRSQFTKSALAKAGIGGLDINDASRDVIKDASRRFGNEYENIAKNNNLIVDDKLINDLADIAQKKYGRMGKDTAPVVKNIIDEITSAKEEYGRKIWGDSPINGGSRIIRKKENELIPGAYSPEVSIPGTTYHETRKFLGAKANSTNDSWDSRVMKDLQRALDSAFERSLPEKLQGKIADINKRYSAFKPIQKAMDNGDASYLENANISPVALYQQIDTGVGNPLEKLADAGKSILKKQIPDSGTAQRLYMQKILTGGGGLAALAATSGAAGQYSPEAGAIAAATLLGPRATQIVYNSKPMQSYLVKGLPGKNIAAFVQEQLPKLAAAGYSNEQIKQIMLLPPENALKIINGASVRPPTQ